MNKRTTEEHLKFSKGKVKTIWGDVMKEFLKDLLILLSSPLYIIGMLTLGIFVLAYKVGDNLMYHVNKWIDFMKDDYKKIYEVIKSGSKQR